MLHRRADEKPPPYSAESQPSSSSQPVQLPPSLPIRPSQVQPPPSLIRVQGDIRTLHFYKSGLFSLSGKVKDFDKSTILYRWQLESSWLEDRKLGLYETLHHNRKIGVVGVLHYNLLGQQTGLQIHPPQTCLYTTLKANPSLGMLSWVHTGYISDHSYRAELRDSNWSLLATFTRVVFALQKVGRLEIMPSLRANETSGLLDEVVASALALLEYRLMLDQIRNDPHHHHSSYTRYRQLQMMGLR